VRDPSHPAAKNRKLAVLVVDDEPLIRWSLRQALVERGHAVTTAANGAEALAAIESAVVAFDVVVLDYRLPDSQDLTLLDAIRRQSPGSGVVMMTAFADDGMRGGALDRGVRAVVDKPFQVRAVVGLVEGPGA
jgi:DNA-binding NtrC family response regulator